jgi:hypothetical protein
MLKVVDFLNRIITTSLLALWAACVMPAGQETPDATQERPFFSGIVTALASDKLSVSRTILGKADEQRTFRITGSTRIEGKLKLKSRVTVQFAAGDEGDVAVSIVVRDKPDKPK